MRNSLVLATYNGERFIQKQLHSILMQSISFDEVIIVDDTSKDNTVKIVEDFIREHKLENWVLYKNSENLGYRGNFKKGLQLAIGDIIYLCDQDDIWLPNKVEQMSSIMCKEEIKLLASSFTFIDEEDKSFIIKKVVANKSNNNLLDMKVETLELVEVPLSLIIRKNFSQGCCMAIKKEIISDFLQCSQGRMPHDWELALLAASKNGCYFLNIPLIQYRIHNENAIGLDFVIENKKQQTTNFRVHNRICVIEEEQEATKFLLRYKQLDSQVKKALKSRNECFNFRKQCITNKKIFPLIQKCIWGEYKKMCNLRMIGGDIVAIIK